MIQDIITDVLKAEGWDAYTNHPADRGGPTKWGITLEAWEEFVGRPCTARDVQAITEAEARTFYQRLYVVEPGFHLLPDILMALMVDCAVNHGQRAAVKWLQRAVGAKQDGDLGPKTRELVGLQTPSATYLKVCASRVRLYGYLVTRDPKLKAAKDAGFRLQAEFSHGWNNRAAKWLDHLATFYLRG